MFDKKVLHFLRSLLMGLVCFLGLGSFVYAQKIDSTSVVSARAPVWTEKFGEVPLDKYTQEELSQMVRDFSTPERMRKAIPMELRKSPIILEENSLHSFFYHEEST